MPTTKRPASEARGVFGRNLRTVRKARKLTLEDVAEKSDMNWSYIAQVERGERNVGIDNMAALADAVAMPLSELLRAESADGHAEKKKEVPQRQESADR